MLSDQIMTIDRILGTISGPPNKENVVKVGICIRPRLDLLAKNEYYQCAQIGENAPVLYLGHTESNSRLEYTIERNTHIILDRKGDSCFYTVHADSLHTVHEVSLITKRMFKPISMSVSKEVDRIAQFIHGT